MLRGREGFALPGTGAFHQAWEGIAFPPAATLRFVQVQMNSNCNSSGFDQARRGASDWEGDLTQQVASACVLLAG